MRRRRYFAFLCTRKCIVTSTPTAPLTKAARQARVWGAGSQGARSVPRLRSSTCSLRRASWSPSGRRCPVTSTSSEPTRSGAYDGTLLYAVGDAVEQSPAPGRTTRLSRLAEELITSCEAAGNLVVVRTPPGGAHLLASAVDGAGLAEVAGTVAGDDTVLLVCRIDDPASDATGAVAGARLAERLLRLADGHLS